MFTRVRFAVVNFAARKGLADANVANFVDSSAKQQARRTGVRGETYTECYLRRHGTVLVARNYTSPGVKGELDTVDCDGPVLAFVKAKTRAVSGREQPTPEESVNADKRRSIARVGRQLLRGRVEAAPARLHVLAIPIQARAQPSASARAHSFLKQPDQRPSLRALTP